MIEYPPDPYMRALAEAIYATTYLEWLILGDLPRVTSDPSPLSAASLSRQPMGRTANALRRAATRTTLKAESAWLTASADALNEVAALRNQVLHSHPATIDGEQRLFRWAIPERSKPQEALEIDEQFLVALRHRAYEHVSAICKVRLSDVGA
jgi:hypothetical protein